MTNEEKLTEARSELFEAWFELQQAAKVIRGQGLSLVADAFDAAAKRKDELAKQLFWE